MKKILNNLITESEQKALLFLAAFAFIGLAARYAGLNAQAESSQPDSLLFERDYEIKYDLRNVTKDELITIPGIGEKRAQDILDYRNEHGFQSKQELMNVKGIGTATFAKFSIYFIDFGDSTLMNAGSNNQKEDQSQTALININTAGTDELMQLPGIGPAKAELIIALRKNLGRFTSKDELLQIKGIGPKTLAKFSDRITLGD